MGNLADQETVAPSSLPDLVIAGPTASGKSEVALYLARALHGEIITVDSMQVYRGLDIGTAKPSPEERLAVPHHLLDIADFRETFDAARFVLLARATAAEIRARGRLPIFCGGTGLYLKAYREGLGEAPAADARVRAELEAIPLPDLLAELRAVDPITFEKIDRQNARRVIRALEVIRLTGKPFANQRAAWGKPANGGACFGLRRAAEDLLARIDRRVEAMFERGLVAETRILLAEGLAENRTAMQAIGYRQVVEHLRGERDLADTIELVKVRTRQFAKRQMTWFRRQAELVWLDVPPTESAEETAERVRRQLQDWPGSRASGESKMQGEVSARSSVIPDATVG